MSSRIGGPIGSPPNASTHRRRMSVAPPHEWDLEKQQTHGERVSGPEPLQSRGALRRAREERLIGGKLGGGFAKGRSVPKHETDLRRAPKFIERVRVVALGYEVIIISEVQDGAPRERPSEIARHRGPAIGVLRIAQVAHLGMAEPPDYRLSRSVGAIVDDDDFDIDAFLGEHAVQGARDGMRAAIGRHDHRDVDHWRIPPASWPYRDVL